MSNKFSTYNDVMSISKKKSSKRAFASHNSDLTTTSNNKWFTSECFDKRRTFY